MTPQQVAQRQLDAYNAHELDSFLACYHPQVEVYALPSRQLQYVGIEGMRERYGPMFSKGEVHARLVSRICVGNVVFDEEDVSGIGIHNLHAVAIYEVENEQIRRIWFVK